MSGAADAAAEIIEEVLRATLPVAWAQPSELAREARAIAKQLPRIKSHRDAALAIERVLRSSFGDELAVSEEQLAMAGRLLALRVRAAGREAIGLEGYTSDEILGLLAGELADTVFTGRPIVFEVGSAQVLGSFEVEGGAVIAEIAHIDGGGEGVLAFLSGLVRRFASHAGLSSVEWRVHALTCAAPNVKLRELLERRGFVAAEYDGRKLLRLVEMIG